MPRATWLAGLLLASLTALPAAAQDAAGKPAPALSIAGRVERPRILTLADLQAMPPAACATWPPSRSARVQQQEPMP